MAISYPYYLALRDQVRPDVLLYYNTDVCQKAGLLNADGSLKPIHGTSEWEAALRAAQHPTPAGARRQGRSVRSAGSPDV